MNSPLISLLLLFLIHGVNINTSWAQFERGSLVIGGTLGYDREVVNDISKVVTNEINFNPEVSYIVGNITSIGIILPIQHQSTHFNADIINHSFVSGNSSISIGPNFRFYYPLDKWAVFMQGNFSYGFYRNFSYSEGYSSHEISQQAKLFTYSAGVGGLYFIKKTIGIEGLFLYNSEKIIYGEGIYVNNLELTSLRLNFGLKLFLLND